MFQKQQFWRIFERTYISPGGTEKIHNLQNKMQTESSASHTDSRLQKFMSLIYNSNITNKL